MTVPRMFAIDPELMCNVHLTDEHYAMHTMVGMAENHPHGEAVLEGMADNGIVDTTAIQERHDLLEAEMRARGMEPDSPLAYEDTFGFGAGEVSPDTSRGKLMRCPDCRERIVAFFEDGTNYEFEEATQVGVPKPA